MFFVRFLDRLPSSSRDSQFTADILVVWGLYGLIKVCTYAYYTHIYIYKYTHIYIYINIHVYIYIYVYTCKSWLSLSNGHIGRLPLLSDKPIYPWFIGQLPVLNGNSSSLKNQCSSLGIIIPFLWLNTWNRQHQPTKFYPISLSWLGYPLVN